MIPMPAPDETYVATLVCDPALPILTDALLVQAMQALPRVAGGFDWLAKGIAADILFAPGRGEAGVAVVERVRTALHGQRVDIIVQPRGTRRKTLLIADMDSTIIGQECIDELADFAGVKAHVAAITERAMRGEIAFEPALRERALLLRGLSTSLVDEVLSARINLTPGGTTLVRTMRANGAFAALISGGFTLFTSRIAERVGFDEHRGNLLEIANGSFSGLVAEPILGRQAKLDTLKELRARLQLERWQTLAVGDGANDLAMLGEAGLGVAFRAKPAVAAAAHARIDHADLTALLYAQGYRREELVE